MLARKLQMAASAGGPDISFGNTAQGFTFDTADISGSTLLDQSPNGLDGTINGMTTTTGVINEAGRFVPNAYVDIGNPPCLLSGDFTLSFNMNQVAETGAIIGRGIVASAGKEYGFVVIPTGGGSVFVQRGTGGAFAYLPTVATNLVGSNKRMGLTYNDTTGLATWYIDGVFDSSGVLETGPLAFLPAWDSGRFALGRYNRIQSELYATMDLDHYKLFDFEGDAEFMAALAAEV